MRYEIGRRARAKARADTTMINMLALFCLGVIILCGFEALIIADLADKIMACKP